MALRYNYSDHYMIIWISVPSFECCIHNTLFHSVFSHNQCEHVQPFNVCYFVKHLDGYPSYRKHS